jgi:hypothetical protein
LPAFCGDLKTVVADGYDQFAAIRGKERSRGKSWTARIQLPGWNDCAVSEWTLEQKTKLSYGCRLPLLDSINAVNAIRDNVARYVRRCFGQGRVERCSQLVQVSEVTFEKSKSDPVVRVGSISYFVDDRYWVLNLDVDAPADAEKQ